MESKCCTDCGEIKPLDGFYKASKNRDGLMSACKCCHSKSCMKSAKKNRARILIYRRAWLKQKGKYHRRYRLFKDYGITLDDYDIMLDKQLRKCAICDRKHETHKMLHVDHSHETGKIRGLLCQQCNHAIGLFGESRATMKRALQYLSQ